MKKSKKERKKIALGVSSVVTLVALGGWFFLTWGSVNVKKNENSFASPIASLKENFNKFFNSTYTEYEKAKEKIIPEFTQIIDMKNFEYGDIKNQDEATTTNATSTEE